LSEIYKDCSSVMGFSSYFSTAYHQAANGQVERANQSIESMLKACMAETNTKMWDELLQHVCFAYNNTVNSVTKETPYFLVHGFDAVNPVDIEIEMEKEIINVEISDFKEKLAVNVRIAWKKANEYIINKQILKKHSTIMQIRPKR
jgi:hypothetical protein